MALPVCGAKNLHSVPGKCNTVLPGLEHNHRVEVNVAVLFLEDDIETLLRKIYVQVTRQI